MEAETCIKNHPEPQQRIKIEQSTAARCLWFAAWLFTIGYLHLHFWRGALALIVWPYYIGVHVSTLIR